MRAPFDKATFKIVTLSRTPDLSRMMGAQHSGDTTKMHTKSFVYMFTISQCFGPSIIRALVSHALKEEERPLFVRPSKRFVTVKEETSRYEEGDVSYVMKEIM